MLPPQTGNVITPPRRLCQFAEVIASSLSLASVCMAVTSATLNGEINYHRCHLWWHRSQFDHVNQMIGPLDVGALCNHALMEGIKMHLGHLTVFIIRGCHWVTWTINWLTRSHCHSLTLIKKIMELRCLTWNIGEQLFRNRPLIEVLEEIINMSPIKRLNCQRFILKDCKVSQKNLLQRASSLQNHIFSLILILNNSF